MHHGLLRDGHREGIPRANPSGDCRKYGRTVSQIVLRWLVQQDGVVTLSRTANEQRIIENLAIFDFVLEKEDMQRIFGLDDPMSRIVLPPLLSRNWDPTPAG